MSCGTVYIEQIRGANKIMFGDHFTLVDTTPSLDCWTNHVTNVNKLISIFINFKLIRSFFIHIK